MYQFQRSVVRYVTGPAGLVPYDISAIPLNVFYKYFKEALIVVHDGIYNVNVTIKYSDYQAEFGQFTGLISDWLLTKANEVLKTYETVPKETYGMVTLHDIQYEWFTLLPGNVLKSNKDQDLITVGDAPDIRIHKTDNSQVNYPELKDYTLWLMNNHMVRAVADEKDIYLLNAGKHFNVNNNTHVCCMNFKGIGKVKTLGIKKEDIQFTSDSSAQHLKIKCSEDLKNKTVWMVLGGRLYMSDVIQVVSGNSVVVKTSNVDWFEKLFCSREWLDLSKVFNPKVAMLDKDYFSTGSFFTNLATDLSSFFVIIDNPNVSVSLVPLGEYQFPFTYYTERTEKLPLLLSNGLMPKYAVRKMVDKRLLDIDAGIHKTYLFHTSGVNNGGVFHEAVNLGNNSRYNRGYLLEIKALRS